VGPQIAYIKTYITFVVMLAVVAIVKFIVEICIGNKCLLVWMDTVGSCVGIVLLAVQLRRSDVIRNTIFNFTFKSC
jgi:hypothetical protein